MVRAQKIQKTVKAFETDIALINEYAKHLGCTAAEVIHDMCEELRKEAYLQELGESFDSLLNNPAASEELKAEQKSWDCTLSDGLADAS
jgi:hypothetical protein